MVKESGSGWIPCTERMPEKEGFYLISVDSDYAGQPQYIVRIGHFNEKYGLFYDYGKLVEAWQPLPEPWKGGAK